MLLQVLDDVEGLRFSDEVLAQRRWEHLHEALVARGVPSDAFARPLRYAPFGTQVDVLVIEHPVQLP